MRLLHIFEKSRQTTTLYRGDSSEIDQFSMSKADPQAMVGRGIYLTSNYDVARDYTIKGQQGVLYRSGEGEADKPREFIQNQFADYAGSKVGPLKEAYTWGIAGFISGFEQTLNQEVSTIIGVGREAREHPRFAELSNWKRMALKYAEAFAYKSTEKMFLQQLRAFYDAHYKAFKQTFEGTRMMKTVLDELIVIPEELLGHVSRFRVPNYYLERMYPVDAPMPDWLMKWIVDHIGSKREGFDPASSAVDLRFNDPEQGEIRADSFNDWLDKFKEHGMRYAWGDHNVGGQGENPSLLEFALGTHLGQSLQYADGMKFWDDIREALKAQGHTGLHYEGGKHTGTDTFAGGSPVKHDAYVLWDDQDVRAFRINSKEIGMDSTDPSLFKNYKFDHMVGSNVTNAFAEKKQILKTRSDIANVEAIEEEIREWIKSGQLQQRMEKAVQPPEIAEAVLAEKEYLTLGMSRYDVDMDVEGRDVHMRVLQNGMDVAEVIYEDGEIIWIHVEPFFRKQGMGSAMIEFLQDKGFPVVMPDARTGDGKAFFGKLDQKGKLDEITLAGSFDDDRSGEFRRFNAENMSYYADTSVGSIASADSVNDTGSKQFWFTDDDEGEPIGYAYAQFGNNPVKYARTSMIWIMDDYRGQGLAGEYYQFILEDLGRSLISDNEHSPESYQVWWKLVQQYDAVIMDKQGGQRPINSENEFDSAYEGDQVIVVSPRRRTQPMTEAFDSTTTFEVFDQGSDYVHYKFRTKNDRPFAVTFEISDENPNAWEVSFGLIKRKRGLEGWSLDTYRTREGNANEILATVASVAQNFIQQRRPKALVFSGQKSSGMAGFYNRLVPYFAKKLGFRWYTTDKGASDNYSNFVIDLTDGLNEDLASVRTYEPSEIAKHHGVDVRQINQQLRKGIEVELEHTKDRSAAREIALDHLLELPDYYDRLADMEGDIHEDATSYTDGYTENFYDTMETLWDRGKPVDVTKVSPDAMNVLEDEEFDYDWRYVMVPLSVFPDYDVWGQEEHETEARFEFLRNNPRIFKTNPILIQLDYDTGLLPLADGHHRVTTAKELGYRELPAVIGRPQ